MARKVLSFFQRKWYISALGLLVLVLLLGPRLRGMSFNIRLSQFLPENDTVEAENRVSDLFSPDVNVHYMMFAENNNEDDILAPGTLRTAYQLCREVEEVAGVAEVQSVPYIYHRVLTEGGGPALPGASDEEIANLTHMFRRVLTESDPEIFLEAFREDRNLTLSAGEIRDVAEVFLSKDLVERGKARYMLVFVFLDPSLSPERRKVTVERIMKLSADAGGRESGANNSVPFIVEHTGEDLMLAQMDREIEWNKYYLSAFAVVLMSTVLYLSFRRLSRVILPLLTLGAALMLTFGVSDLLGMETSPLSLAVIPLVVGLGIDFFYHLLKRYDEEIGGDLREALRNEEHISPERVASVQERALERSLKQVARPLVIAGATTIIAFMGNVFSRIDTVVNFGLLCSMGIGFSLLLTFFFLYPTIGALDRYMSKKRLPRYEKSIVRAEQTPYLIGRSMNDIARWVTVYPVLVLVVIVLITTASLISGVHVEKEFSLDDFISSSLESSEAKKRMEKRFNASSASRVYYLYEGRDIPEPSTIMDMADKMLYVEKAPHVVRVDDDPRTSSLLILFQDAIERNATLAERFNFSGITRLPLKDNCTRRDIQGFIDYLDDNSTRYDQLANTTYSEELRNVYLEERGEYYAIMCIYVEARTEKSSEELVRELERPLGEEGSGLSVTLTGWTVIAVRALDTMETTQIRSTVTAILLAFIILLAVYRDIRMPVIGVIPVLFSAIWVMGFMYLFSVSLNILTISVTALSVGIGVDYSVHIIERFRQEKKRVDEEKAMMRTLKHTGASIFMSAFTTISGFLILLIGSLPVMRIFGLITGVAVLFAFLLACVLAPVILLKSIRK